MTQPENAKTPTFYIFGDYGYEAEKELYQTSNFAEALKEFEAFQGNEENLMGHRVIELASFAPDGEYVTYERVMAEL